MVVSEFAPRRASGWRLLLVAVLAYALAQVAAGLVLYAFAGFPISAASLRASVASMQSGHSIAVSSAVGEVVMPLVGWLLLRRFLRARDIRLRAPRMADITAGVGLLLLTVVLSAVFGALLHTGDVASQVSVAGHLRSLWWEAPAIAVSAGVAEEILFRGYLLEGLLRVFRGRTWVAVPVSALAFALAHLSWGISALQFLFYVALGVLFALFVLRRRNLWPAIIAHAAWDGLAFLLLATRAGG